ncbi:hypothetical protein DFH09DRAFT_1334834 [Mycena vulgaris]|nr:hypothetical protein DFH09DRAFT_1334834 [Mycena vulgaris]
MDFGVQRYVGKVTILFYLLVSLAIVPTHYKLCGFAATTLSLTHNCVRLRSLSHPRTAALEAQDDNDDEHEVACALVADA